MKREDAKQTDKGGAGERKERRRKEAKKGGIEGGKKELSESEVSGGRIKTGFGNFH